MKKSYRSPLAIRRRARVARPRCSRKRRGTASGSASQVRARGRRRSPRCSRDARAIARNGARRVPSRGGFPRDLDPSRHAQILARALAPRPGKVRSLAFGGIASLAALAAAFALFMGQRSRPVPTSSLESQAQSAAGPTVAVSRSTTALFPDGIPATGGTSERVDRIAFARAQDLRENRFARWGVR